MERKYLKHWLKGKIKFTSALLVTFFITGSVIAIGADNVGGVGNGVAIGTGSNANDTNDISIGKNSEVSNYYKQNGSVVIGSNAKAENMMGLQEYVFGFNQGAPYTPEYKWFILKGATPGQPEKVLSSVAIGENSYARTGGTVIGSHKFKGTIGDMEIDTDKSKGGAFLKNVLSTSVGANNFVGGAGATSIGAYSVISTSYDGGTFGPAQKNFGATSVGAFNTIESKSAQSDSAGVANTIQGVANRTYNSNGSILIGAGNEVTNSIQSLSVSYLTNNPIENVNDLTNKFRKTIRDSKSAGSTLAIGGGNKADYTLGSQLTGVNNILTGTKDSLSEYVLLNGFNNEGTNVKHISVIGSNNKLAKAENGVVFGDNNVVKENVKDTFVMGNNIEVSNSNNVILGNNSADKKEQHVSSVTITTTGGENVTLGNFAGTATGVVSVGADGKERQVVNVAPGEISATSTDAINGSQLYAIIEKGGVGSSSPSIPATKLELKGQGAAIITSTGDDAHKVYTVDVKQVVQYTDKEGNDVIKIKGKYHIVKNGEATDKLVDIKDVQVRMVNPDGTTTTPTNLTNIADGKVAAGSTDAVNGGQLYTTNQQVANNSRRIDENVREIRNLRKDHNNGMAQMAAMTSVDFVHVNKNRVKVGAAVGGYKGARAVAVGVAYAPTDHFLVDAKWSTPTNTHRGSAFGVGATYEFNCD